jgi:uncharacterized membrane protein
MTPPESRRESPSPTSPHDAASLNCQQTRLESYGTLACGGGGRRHLLCVARELVGNRPYADGLERALLLLVLLTCIRMIRLDAKQMRARYEEVDPTAPVILLVVVAAAVLSVIAIVALLSTVKQVGSPQAAALVS